MQTSFFSLGRFLKKLADDQGSSITKGSIYHIKHMYMQPFTVGVNWLEIWCLMEVSAMFYICRYCGRVIVHVPWYLYLSSYLFVCFRFCSMQYNYASRYVRLIAVNISNSLQILEFYNNQFTYTLMKKIPTDLLIILAEYVG